MKTYKLADRPNQADKNNAGIHKGEKVRLAAIAIGQYRPPLAGEWYISGAEPEAYRARGNMSSAYHIAKLIKVARRR